MSLSVLLTVLGTLAAVLGAAVAVLQLRRTPALPESRFRRRRERAQSPVGELVQTASAGVPAGSDGNEKSAGKPAVLLHAPTGRLTEVWGRSGLLEALETKVGSPDGRFEVLAGLGGTGKTTVALALAERVRDRGDSVWWISGVDSASVSDGMLAVAARLGAARADIEQARAGSRHPADVVWDRLEEHARWLLVIDNVDDVSALQVAGSSAADGTGWLRPTHAGLIVVTSRVTDRGLWGWHGHVGHVGSLDEQDGAQMLLALAPHAGSEQEAIWLSRRLGGLPLALHHAGSYIASPFTPEHSFATYRAALNKRFAEIMGHGSEPRSVVTTTWEISLDALAAAGKPQARPLLRVLSCFEPSVGIRASLLDYGILATACAEMHQVDLRGGLEALVSLGLLETRHEPGMDEQAIVVHPLVAEASRLHLDGIITNTAANLLQAATARLDYATPRDWPAWLAILPHLRAMLRLPGDALTREGLTALAHAAARTCFALSWSGAHVASGDLARTAQAAVAELGGDHEAVLALRYQNAISSRYQGRYREAESELGEVLAAQRNVLGPDDPATLATQQEAARVMANLGRYAESEAACREVLAARLRVLGSGDLDTLITRHYLARALAEQGKYIESEAADAELLDMSRRVVGDEHYFTLLIRKDLAVHLNSKGQCAQAERDLRTLMQDWAEMPDNDYTYVLDARYELGRAITGQGRYQEASEYLAELLQDELRVRGPDHPHTLLTRDLIAEGLDAQGQHQHAESEFRDIHERQARTLGPNHPRTLMTRSRLARATAAQGRMKEAAHIYQEIYREMVDAIGASHPETQAVSQALAELPDQVVP